MSSPHARGSSCQPERSPVAVGVVPARAGIFPAAVFTRACLLRRPRTRGDLPEMKHSSSTGVPSSPHARGSSLGPAHPLDGAAVVPARAGIFPPSPRCGCSPAGRPRTRGDLPGSTPCTTSTSPSSPHARGSSPEHDHGRLSRAVVPARAGIFPVSADSTSHPCRRPRTRGDLPVPEHRPGGLRPSSPHARGSSGLVHSDRGRGGVVPARAGIFLFSGALKPIA